MPDLLGNTLNRTLDSAFGIHADALRFRAARGQVLAANLANADTPNYQARDLDFREVLESSQGRQLNLHGSHQRHINTETVRGGGELLYRQPYQPSLDGNTVEAEVEQASFSRNSLQYQASVMFLSGRISGIKYAIRGGA